VGVACGPAVFRPAGLFIVQSALTAWRQAAAAPPRVPPDAVSPDVLPWEFSCRLLSGGVLKLKQQNLVFLFLLCLNLPPYGFMIVSTLKKGGDPEANEYW
jgi:hypothetical protein